MLILADVFSKLKAEAFKSDTIKGLIMKKYILALLIVPALACAAEDGSGKALAAEKGLVCVSETLDDQSCDRVCFDQEDNCIRARNMRNSKYYTVETNVSKNLKSGEYWTSTSRYSVHDRNFYFFNAIPEVAERLKEKIAAFELARKDS